MPSRDKLIGCPALSAVHNPSANTAAVVTIPAPPTGQCIYVTGISLSLSAAPATALAATMTGSGATRTWRLPAAATAPIVMFYGNRPIKCAEATACVVTLPDPGASATGSVIVDYFIDSV